MIFTIPQKFLDPFIFAALFAESCKFQWDRKHFQEKLKDSDFRENYEQMRLRIGNQPLGRIASHFNVKFILEKDGKLFNYGDGKEIYIKKKTQHYKIFTNPYRFFYVPEGVALDGQILSNLEDILISKSIFIDNIEAFIDGNFLNFTKLEQSYNISINVYEKIKNASTKNYTFKTLRLGAFESERVEINLHFQAGSNSFLFIHSIEKYLENNFECKNKENGCLISYSKKNLLENHEKNCKKIEEIYECPEIIQKEIKNFDFLIKKVQNRKLLNKFPSNDNFLFFDIESVLPNSAYKTKKMRILSHHKLVSIAANSYINGHHNSKVWVVKDESLEAEIEVVENFLDFCFEAQSLMNKNDNLDKIFEFLDTQSNSFHTENFDLEEISNLRQIFLPFRDLPVFGYNNAKYDNSVIFEHIIKILDKRKIKPSEIQLLKKGPHYFSLKFFNLHFKDLINFFVPTSLDNYLKTWAPNYQKLIYPYERFSSIFEIRDCVDFPTKDDFFLVSKGAVDDNLYEKCKKIYDSHHCLPENHPNFWPNFENYLKYYNLSDVQPASLGLLKQFETYRVNFGLSPMQYLGLPSFARAAMLKMYDKNCPSMFTFPPNSPATRIFRDQLIGGLCNCYIRHITTDSDETCAHAAKYNKNGKKWSEISFYDINAQYPSTFRKKFPCGLGLEWTNMGGILSKKLMTTKKISLGSVEWLDYMNKTDSRLVKKDGTRMQIISGWGSSEVRIGPYKVDGFSRNGDKIFIYEYDGCFFHGCEKCSMAGLTKKDDERESFLKKIPNVEIIRMKECFWLELKKSLTWRSKISPVLNVRKLAENRFIEYLNENKLYGFALVNIKATKNAQKFLDINWPPLFFKSEIHFEDIPSWMRLNTKSENFPRTTVVQGMFHEKLLLHTELLKLYIDNGFQIINVFKFFEYQGEKCFKIIHDKVYKARVEATLKNDKMKTMAVKLVSNSMYGQMLMVIYILIESKC